MVGAGGLLTCGSDGGKISGTSFDGHSNEEMAALSKAVVECPQGSGEQHAHVAGRTGVWATVALAEAIREGDLEPARGEAMLTEGDLDRGCAPDVAPSAPQRWHSSTREARPDFCLRGHRGRFLEGWESGHGRFYACQAAGCASVQYRY